MAAGRPPALRAVRPPRPPLHALPERIARHAAVDAHDRERHLLAYLRASGVLDGIRGMRVLHFAPERRLAPLVAAAGPASYVRCDLFPDAPGVEQVDMAAMPYPDAAFDLLIANHVLEHVDDLQQALREIVRVLAPGGHAVLQTPFCASLHRTWEDPGIREPAARLQAYGQEDHVRLFGRDIAEVIAAAGLESRVRGHRELLAYMDPMDAGVNAEEPFFLFRKPGPGQGFNPPSAARAAAAGPASAAAR